MPPTSFFAGNTIDEDNLDIEDLDSILDDCLALGMPQTNLRWHYRSRHESLIAFSNREFYENSMFTFPSANDREKRVNLVKTEGFFDRGKKRVNEGEAKAVVAELRRRFHDPALKKQSIGVITFNISQQSLIEDLLKEEYRRDPDFERWANDREEPLFVKNLENVQGDERDVILFSVAYGPDDQGILRRICQSIADAGYRYQTAVGHSRFKVDIAVVHPRNPEAYLLGILLDGDSYRQSSNTKDREISQISILNGLGWKIHRVWTMDWWDNSEREISRLLQVLKQESQKNQKREPEDSVTAGTERREAAAGK